MPTIGEPLDLVGFEPPALQQLGLPRPRHPEVTVVGTYATPADATDWLVPQRLTSTNEAVSDRPGGGYTPYSPGSGHHDPRRRSRPSGDWTVRVDTFLDVPADITPAELGVAARSAASIPDDEAVEVEGGTLADDSTNDLAAVVDEVRVAAGHRPQLHLPRRAVARARGAGAADAAAQRRPASSACRSSPWPRCAG